MLEHTTKSRWLPDECIGVTSSGHLTCWRRHFFLIQGSSPTSMCWSYGLWMRPSLYFGPSCVKYYHYHRHDQEEMLLDRSGRTIAVFRSFGWHVKYICCSKRILLLVRCVTTWKVDGKSAAISYISKISANCEGCFLAYPIQKFKDYRSDFNQCKLLTHEFFCLNLFILW